MVIARVGAAICIAAFAAKGNGQTNNTNNNNNIAQQSRKETPVVIALKLMELPARMRHPHLWRLFACPLFSAADADT
jgi:hypothetical protein